MISAGAMLLGDVTPSQLRKCKPTRKATVIRLPKKVKGQSLSRSARKITLTAEDLKDRDHPQVRQNAEILSQRWLQRGGSADIAISTAALGISVFLGVKDLFQNDVTTAEVTTTMSGDRLLKVATGAPDLGGWNWLTAVQDWIPVLGIMAILVLVLIELFRTRWARDAAGNLHDLVVRSAPADPVPAPTEPAPAPTEPAPSPGDPAPPPSTTGAALRRVHRLQTALAVIVPIAAAAVVLRTGGRERASRR